jgi:hypothetical protein
MDIPILNPLIVVLLSLFLIEFVALFVLFVLNAHRYLRLRAYTRERHPEAWTEFVDSGRLTIWLATNVRDWDILKRYISTDSRLAELIKGMETSRSRYIKVFLSALLTFVCVAIVIFFIARR